MENATGFGTQDIITGRGLGIGGFGYNSGGLGYGNNVLAANAHADGTGLGTRVECNGKSQAAQLDRLSAQNEETRRILQNDEIRKDVSDFRLQTAITDGQSNLAFADRLSTMAANSAECCCDTKLLIVEKDAENEKRFSLLSAQAERLSKEAVLRELDTKDRQLQTQAIISACGCGCPTTTCL